MASKKRTKPPQGRPISTSAISHPVVQDSSHLTVLSSFSPNGNHFAFLSLAVDKHRLRVYNTVSGQSIAELVVDSARVSALTWGTFDPSDEQHYLSKDGLQSPSKKKKRKRDNLPTGEDVKEKATQFVILGLSDGAVLFFSPSHGRVLRTLSHPASTSEIVSVVVLVNGDNTSTVWTSGADGTISVWNAQKNEMLVSWKNEDRIPVSSLATQPKHLGGPVHILTAHHAIRLLSVSPDNVGFEKIKPIQLASFTGHASPVRQLQWDMSQTPSTRFVSLGDADRFLYIWETPQGSSMEGKPAAYIPLDSEARSFSLSVSDESKDMVKRQILLTLSASGKISLFPIPAEFVLPASSNLTQHKLPTLLPRSTLSAPPNSAAPAARIVNATFSAKEEGYICIARVIGGIQPIFDVVQYLDTSGEFIQNVIIDDVKTVPPTDPPLPISTQRYAEAPSLAVGSGVQLGQDEEMDRLAEHHVEGDLDVDLAELSLGQRLTALTGTGGQPSTSESDDDSVTARKESKSSKMAHNEVTVVPANSLTRTLIQALHSSDSRLLEICLAHSDKTLIHNTVRRVPPQLAVSLITACVERLGRGARGGNMKGRGGGASSQRGMGLITWVKTTLIVHSGHLMTIPDLVARLSGLHATLTSRLVLQESLLSLSGRLDMVLSQIELRSSATPAALAPQKGKERSNKQNVEVVRYVEGESGEEDEGFEQMDVESGDEEGSVEDIELGGSGDDEDKVSDDEDEEGDDSEGPTMNGFIDDEAEEYSEEDESE